jgi:formylglycine-generating enzyme required for sulfatase activity
MEIKQFYPYSPRKAAFEQLSNSFVARDFLLEELISSIRGQADSEAIQHWMIIGARGMGKSHLVSLAYQTVENNVDLNQVWIPLLMHEEELSVFSLPTLFIRFLTKMGEETARTDKKRSKAIYDFLDELRTEDKQPGEILESVEAYIKDFVKETGKKLLVFMENSDDIFSRYISKKNDIKKFRNMLQHDNFMLLIATSSTLFDGISNPAAPLYQFFRIRSLEQFTYEQSVELLNRWMALDFNPSNKSAPFFRFDKDDYKLQTLCHLTGGIPRVVLFLYMAAKEKGGIQSPIEIFSKLLEEDLSNYYLNRLGDLSSQVQPIILALAESDRNLTQKEISQKTFLPMKSIGTAMLRLEKERLVGPVTEKKGKNTLYTLTDPLFRFWHQWRISPHNKEIIKSLVMCVAVWYKIEALNLWSVSDDIIDNHSKDALQYRQTENIEILWKPLQDVLANQTSVSDLLPILDNVLSSKDTGEDYKVFIHFIRAFIFLYQQDRTPFLKDLNDAAEHLNKLTEEKKHEISGLVIAFLTNTLQKKNIHIHSAYVAELRNISTELSVVFRSMDYVLDYFEILFSDEKDKKKQTGRALRARDSINAEIRGLVEKMIEKIIGNDDTDIIIKITKFIAKGKDVTDIVTKIIKSIEIKSSDKTWKDLNRKDQVRVVLCKNGMKPGRPDKVFESIYGHALVEYGVEQPEPIMNIFRHVDIQKLCRQLFIEENFSGFFKKKLSLIELENIGEDLRIAYVVLRDEFKLFIEIFENKMEQAKEIPVNEIENYCKKAASFHSTLPVAGFVTLLEVAIDIEDIYVDLHAVINLQGVADESYHSADHAQKVFKGSEKSLDITLADAFLEIEKRKKRGFVILGDPGSGKTTHLKKILLFCLRKSPEALGLPSDMLPVFLPLRELRDLRSGLDAFVQDQLDKPHLNTPEGFGKRLLERGNILFLLDGLDEVVDIEHREQVLNWIKDAIRTYSSCRFVVSCRYAGYSKSVKMNEFFLEMHIRPFAADQADKFVHEWYRVVEKSLAKDVDQVEQIAKEKADSLIGRLKEPEFRSRKVFELTRNPLLLTNICLVHYHRGTLPEKRARLYQECIDVLLQHWRESKKIKIDVTAQEGRRILQPAALWMHQEKNRIYATADELAPQIEPALKTVKWTNGSAKEFFKTIRDESGLLTGWDQEHFGFMHLGFQEYLAAREIQRLTFENLGIQFDVIHKLALNFGDSWWQEVTLILLALEGPSFFVPFMKEVVKFPAFVEHAGFVETCLEDAAEISMEPFVALLEQNPEDDRGLWERQLIALRIVERNDLDKIEGLKSILVNHPFDEIKNRVKPEHLKAMDIVADKPVMGRPILNIHKDYELVKIPGGTFMMGSYKGEEGRYNDEGPVHKVQIPDFYMGKYPVTNEEYSRFLQENHDVDEPEYWGDRKFNQSKQPVAGVAWHDAKKYADWAGLRLPGEAEWEYACRAGTSSRFYTGDTIDDLDRAVWYRDNSGDRLHPVGEKEPNDFGLYDMHGNVWEWVEDDWHKNYENFPGDDSPWLDHHRGDKRVVRGGSWFNSAEYCRSAFRGNFHPDNRYDGIGFRLSRSVTLGP